MQLEPYIYFHGTCEEALNFYATCLGGTIVYLGRFAGSPMESEAAFEAEGIRFMAGDGRPGTPPDGEDDIIQWMVSGGSRQ